MRLSFVFLCLSLATLSLATIPSPATDSSLSRKRHLESSQPSGKRVKKDVGVSRTTGQSSQATKKPVKGGEKVPKKRSRVGATKGAKKTSAGKKSSAVSGSGKDSQESGATQDDRNKFALSFFPKELVELIGEYLEGFFSVIFTRNCSAADSRCSVAVDSERHYLITYQDIQASSHGDDKPVNIGSSDLSGYADFHSSHNSRFLFFTGQTKEQADSDSFEITARWLVQDTGTKSLKSVPHEGGEIFNGSSSFELSANGETLLVTHYASNIWTTFVYQIEEHEKAASASKKADFDGLARAVSGNGNRILVACMKKGQLEIHDISGDERHLALKIKYAGVALMQLCALNNDGSKAAFTDDNRKLYIVDVGKEKGSISVDQLTTIDIPDSVIGYSLSYDAKDRLYAFKSGNLWLVDPSKRELVSLEEPQVPQEYEIQRSAISSSADYIALLIRSKSKNEKGKHQFQMVVKRNTKDVLMRLCRCKS